MYICYTLKQKKKSPKKKNYNRAKSMASPTNYRGSKPTDSQKKKKKKRATPQSLKVYIRNH